MFNLTVATDNLENVRKVLNEANIYNKVGEKSEDGSLTTLKFKSQEELDKAREVLT